MIRNANSRFLPGLRFTAFPSVPACVTLGLDLGSGGRALTQALGHVGGHRMTRATLHATLHANHLRIRRVSTQHPVQPQHQLTGEGYLRHAVVLALSQAFVHRPNSASPLAALIPACTRRNLIKLLPCLAIEPSRRCSPLEFSRGINPR